MLLKKYWLSVAGINGLLAVIMGAIAAHAIADKRAAALADKASLYQLVHAVVLLAIADCHGRLFEIARWMFLTGIILFSGTIYVRVLTEWADITKLAPIGGVSLMAGWLLLIGGSYNKK